MPVLITLRGLGETTHPRTVGDFIWHEASGRHLLRGQPFTAEQFNDFAASREWDRIIEREGARLQIRVVHHDTQPESVGATVAFEIQKAPTPGTILDKAKTAPPPAKQKRARRK